jgi:hypothetical protein
VALDFQVTVDCTEPHQLAEWWAEALEWEVERQDAAFIQRMIDEGHASEADTTIHAGELKWRTGAAIVADVAGTRRRILFQFVVPPTPRIRSPSPPPENILRSNRLPSEWSIRTFRPPPENLKRSKTLLSELWSDTPVPELATLSR